MYILEQLAWEVVRAQAAKSTPSLPVVGGIVSQEAIKLITGQFVPSHGRVCVHLADGEQRYSSVMRTILRAARERNRERNREREIVTRVQNRKSRQTPPFFS